VTPPTSTSAHEGIAGGARSTPGPPAAICAYNGGVLSPGSVLHDRYEIIELLAKGGMGAVFRARRRLLGDEVAIKVIRAAGYDAGEMRDRFLRESRACAQLRHPHIVTILDFDLDVEQRPFLVMELLNGPSLREELRQHGRIEPAAVQTIVGPLAGAIQLAHDRGIVHRDLKPANIVSHRFETGEVVWKIIDFGLANLHAGADETRPATSAEFVGTATYAAPEQLRGDPVDPGADIYALGAIVYEMLTGQPPFPGTDLLSIVSRQLTGDPARPGSMVEGIPPWMDQVVLRAIAKRREERWHTVVDFAQALAGSGELPTVVSAPFRAPALPSWLEKYELERPLGKGRLGSEIFAGRHRALGLPVAVRISRRLQTPNWEAVRVRFLREARALQAPHPSILQVRDFGEEDGVIYLVTELVAGPSLREVLAGEAPLGWPRLSRLVGQLLDAAAVIHRDGGTLCGLSPEIIRTTTGVDGERLLISSAGISQVQDLLATLDEQTLRGAGVLDPELPYVAPEVFLGRPPDVRADVFTLGVLMYEMATGRLPFHAGHMHQLLGAAMTTRPLDPRQLEPGLPDAFAAATLRCLRPDPAERPAGPLEVLDRLRDQAGDGPPIGDGPTRL
jgi:serine/threonine protein kinase